jgi:site-specific DNA recombinase
MEAARERAFEIVIVEALDRLSRDMEDLAGIYKRLTFLGIEIRAVHDGTADSILVGIRGLVGQLQLQDTAKKVRRGMAGVLRDGRHPGGRAYGYRPVLGERGELVIVEEEAAVIRRIFEAYVEGERPRDIARALNEEAVPPPRGARWNASTINGNATRGHGLILNELYAGRIVWNKVRMLKNPDTGRRISRANPRPEWQSADAPHLRIIEQALFERAQKVKAERAQLKSHQKRRPTHMFSGLLKCGACGGGMSAQGPDRHGYPRVRCTRAKESGDCHQGNSVRLDRIEAAVLAGMRDQLRDPRLIEAYLRRYNAERAKAAASANTSRAKLEAHLARVAAERERIVDLVIKDILKESDSAKRLKALAEERDKLDAELAATAKPPKVIALHPATLERYLQTVESLAATLSRHAAMADSKGKVIAALRELVHSITVHHKGAHQGVEVEVKGRLAALIGGSVFPTGVRGHVVAEAGLEPATYGL